MKAVEANERELDLLLEALHCRTGKDLRNYSRAFLKRRLEGRLGQTGHARPLDYLATLLTDERALDAFLSESSIVVTEMFRDPPFWRALREHVIPELAKRPLLRIWHAGCATGDEAFSLAVTLHEAGLLRKSQIFATDYNSEALKRATSGIVDIAHLPKHAESYYQSGGTHDFSDYVRVRYDSGRIAGFLRQAIVFGYHDLTTAPPLADVDLILCRNVMIYFDRESRVRVLKGFTDALGDGGYLGIGSLESLVDAQESRFTAVTPGIQLHRRI